MSTQKSAIALRTLLCDTLAQFYCVNTSILPEGSTCYVAENKSVWRLRKSLGTALDDLIPNSVVKGANQSSARWVLETFEGVSPYFTQVYGSGSQSLVIANNNWILLGTTPGSFSIANYIFGDEWSLDDAANLLTYKGPQQRMRVTVNITMLGQTTGLSTIYGCIRLNNDVAVGTTNSYQSRGQGGVAISSAMAGQLRLERLLTLNTDDVLSLALRNSDTTEDLTIPFYTMTVAPT